MELNTKLFDLLSSYPLTLILYGVSFISGGLFVALSLTSSFGRSDRRGQYKSLGEVSVSKVYETKLSLGRLRVVLGIIWIISAGLLLYLVLRS